MFSSNSIDRDMIPTKRPLSIQMTMPVDHIESKLLMSCTGPYHSPIGALSRLPCDIVYESASLRFYFWSTTHPRESFLRSQPSTVSCLLPALCCKLNSNERCYKLRVLSALLSRTFWKRRLQQHTCVLLPKDSSSSLHVHKLCQMNPHRALMTLNIEIAWPKWNRAAFIFANDCESCTIHWTPHSSMIFIYTLFLSNHISQIEVAVQYDVFFPRFPSTIKRPCEGRMFSSSSKSLKSYDARAMATLCG